MTRFGLGAALAVAILLASPAHALRITHDEGGEIGSAERYWQSIGASGQAVEVDGRCFSACTFLTMYVQSGRICVTPRADLVFHAAWSGERVMDHGWTAYIFQRYPRGIRSWITSHGGLTSPNRHLHLRGAALRGFYRPC